MSRMLVPLLVLALALFLALALPTAPATAQEEATGDYYTIKYNENGSEIWHKVYDSGNWDYAYGVAVDSQGNVIVTGAIERWHEEELNYDYYTIKYNPNGTKIWDATYDAGDRDEAFAVAVDSEGNVIVTGRSHNGADYDYCTIKYNGTDGSEVWGEPVIYDGGGADCANSVAVDKQDNIVVTGYSSDGTTLNYCTIKYDEDGNVVEGWPVIYDSDHEDGALEVAVDSSDNIVVTGGAGRDPKDSTSGDYYTIKYNSSGTELWNKTYNIGPGATSDTAFGAAVDSEGNVIVTGSYYTPPPEGQIFGKWHYYRTIKYSPDGNEITNGWPATYDGADQENAYDVAVDLRDNSVIVTGKVSDGTTWNYYTIKYNSTGIEQWSRTYDGGNWDSCLDVAVDSEGNVIVTGSSQLYPLDADFSAEPTVMELCTDVAFTNHTTGSFPPYSFEWDFNNDGIIDSTDANPTWHYATPGTYTVSLNVTDDEGNTDTEVKEGYITVTGVYCSDPDVTITEQGVTDDPANDPDTYDPTNMPPDVTWEDAKGFYVEANGAAGSYEFLITFDTAVGSEFTLYKLPQWTEVPYTITGANTIQVQLNIDGGDLDPAFVLARQAEDGGGGGGLSSAAIAGIAVGATAGTGVLAFLIWRGWGGGQPAPRAERRREARKAAKKRRKSKR